MTKILITAAIALGLGLISAPSFAKGYVVNGHAASTAEVQLLVSNGVQPGAWVVNGYGIAPAYAGEGEGAVQASAQNTATVMASPAPTRHFAYVTQSSRGTWLFAPHDGAGANG